MPVVVSLIPVSLALMIQIRVWMSLTRFQNRSVLGGLLLRGLRHASSMHDRPFEKRIPIEMSFKVFLTYLLRHASLMRGRLFDKPVSKLDMFLGVLLT